MSLIDAPSVRCSRVYSERGDGNKDYPPSRADNENLEADLAKLKKSQTSLIMSFSTLSFKKRAVS